MATVIQYHLNYRVDLVALYRDLFASDGQGNMKDKVAIITGAASEVGIGRATAERFIAEGVKVILTDVVQKSGEIVAEQLGSNAVFKFLDASNEAHWIDAIAFAQKEFGRLDIVVNNGATFDTKAIDEVSFEAFERVFKVNAGGVLLSCKHAIPVMKESGGSIINISSNSAAIGYPMIPAYSASKGAINSMTRSIAADMRLRNYPIRVNTVMPGGVRGATARAAVLELAGLDSESNEPGAKELRESWLPPENVAAAVAFLASDDAAGINGTEFFVDNALSFTVTN